MGFDFRKITPRVRSGSNASFSTAKSGGGYVLTASLPRTSVQEATHAEVFVDPENRALALKPNNTGDGYKFTDLSPTTRTLRIPATSATHLRATKIPPGAPESTPHDDELRIFVLPDIYWETNE